MLQSYKKKDVDDFILRLIQEFEHTVEEKDSEIKTLKESLELANNNVCDLKSKLDEFLNRKILITDTLLKANETAEGIINQAKEQANALENNAKLVAQDLITDAEKKSKELLEQAALDGQELLNQAKQEEKGIREEIEKLTNDEKALSDRFKAEQDAIIANNREKHDQAMQELELKYSNRAVECQVEYEQKIKELELAHSNKVITYQTQEEKLETEFADKVNVFNSFRLSVKEAIDNMREIFELDDKEDAE
jgi:cell division initiation protein